jgi:hypothetical protein
MDKGMKGFLTGDLGAYAVKQIQISVEQYLPKMEEI